MESIDIKEEVFFEDSTKEIKEELELTKVKCEDSKEGILDDEFAVDIKQIQMKEEIYVWNSFESAQEGSSTDSLTHSVSTTRIQKTDEENQIDYKLQRKRELVKARVKRYRERKRMESQRLNSSMQDDPTEDEIAERKRALSRERSRRYYERKQMESRQLNPSLQDDPTEEEIAERKRALAKERSRRYRERKRMESRQLNTSMQDDPNEEDIGEGTFEKIS